LKLLFLHGTNPLLFLFEFKRRIQRARPFRSFKPPGAGVAIVSPWLGSPPEVIDCFRTLESTLERREGGSAMKAAMIFTGSGPILILTSFDSLDHPTLSEKLGARGVTRYIAYEVSVEKAKKLYGTRFSIILGDLSQTDDMRVMDIDGHHVFNSFSFEELGTPVYSTSLKKSAPEKGPPEERAKEGIEGDWLYVKIDEYGKLAESTYMPMLGSRFEPPISVEPSLASRQVRFQIDPQGVIIHGSPQVVNGRKLIHQGRSSPALGRSDTVVPACTWKPDDKGGWICA